MESIGQRIKRLREENKLTQKELAQQVGITEASLSRYENDLREPKAEIVLRLAKALNTTSDYLLGRANDRPWQPVITPKDERDIAKDLERIMNDLTQADGLMFYNEPIDEEDKELLRQAIEFGLHVVKQKNKAKYTPRKYRRNKGV